MLSVNKDARQAQRRLSKGLGVLYLDATVLELLLRLFRTASGIGRLTSGVGHPGAEAVVLLHGIAQEPKQLYAIELAEVGGVFADVGRRRHRSL